jgi:uncharacterized membrane protein HdeD (DUF308 family)
MATIINPDAKRVLSHGWVFLFLRGLAAIAFGILTWIRPGLTAATLVLLFGSFAIFDGIVASASAIALRRDRDHWWGLLIRGVLGIVLGLFVLANPGASALGILLYIAIWAIATGVLELIVAARWRQEIDGEWRLVVAGLASVIFGAYLVAQPGAGALAILWLIATYAVLLGILLVMLSLKVRSLSQRPA